MPNLIILDREEVEKRRENFKKILQTLTIDESKNICISRIAEIDSLLSISRPSETVIKQAFEAGRMLSNPPELNYTIHKYKTYQDYLNFLNQ